MVTYIVLSYILNATMLLIGWYQFENTTECKPDMCKTRNILILWLLSPLTFPLVAAIQLYLIITYLAGARILYNERLEYFGPDVRPEFYSLSMSIVIFLLIISPVYVPMRFIAFLLGNDELY